MIIDSGTTAYHVAKHLGGKASHVITNSLPVANHFGSDNSVEVLVTGGVIYPRLGVLVGPLAVESLSGMHADVAVMSAGGITLDGITNSHALLIDIQRAMLKSAQRIIFCLDHTKFSRRSVSPLCELDVSTPSSPMPKPPPISSTNSNKQVSKSSPPTELFAWPKPHFPPEP